MNIGEVRSLVDGASYEEKLDVLENICELAGDCIQNGFLGSAVSNISFDEFGYVEFESLYLRDGVSISSTGAVLDEAVIIMQVQESEGKKLLHLYSWKKDGSSYTSLTFDSMIALTKAYTSIKENNIGFLAENIDDDLQRIGISYRDIMDIKVAVSTKREEVLASAEGLDFDTLATSYGL